MVGMLAAVIWESKPDGMSCARDELYCICYIDSIHLYYVDFFLCVSVYIFNIYIYRVLFLAKYLSCVMLYWADINKAPSFVEIINLCIKYIVLCELKEIC